VIQNLNEEESAALLYDWNFWARDDQLLPTAVQANGDPWLIWMILSGRGWGKTKTGAESTIAMVRSGKAKRIALVAETAADCRDVIVEGDSGIMACSPPDFRPVYKPSIRSLEWPNGAIATTYNATEPDQLRGPQHDWAWSDELAKWRYYQETWDNLQFGLRLGKLPRQIVTTTPRPIPLLKELLKNPAVHITRGTTSDNHDNLAGSFLKQVIARYEGTRLGRQELSGELLDDAPGALWTQNMIDQAVLSGVRAPNDPLADGWHHFYSRIIVAVDPSGADGENPDKADDIGIVIAARGYDGRGYVLGDYTVNASPGVWGRRAVDAYHRFEANLLVAEKNFGGAMVQYVIQSTDSTVPYKEVTAARGKAIRAEPIAALYEQGKISHVGSFPELQDELCLMTNTGYLGNSSPNRLDAAVWALSELMLDAGGADLWAKLGQ